MNCLVCNAEAAQVHFGAVVCRACAAFFRRYVNTKKSTIVCNCYAKRESRFPCRLCRMKKCIAIGMQTEKVQGPRDLNELSRKRKMLQLEQSANFPQFTRINFNLNLRTMDRILRTLESYGELEINRKKIFNQTPGRVYNLYEFTVEMKTDSKLLWTLCESTFPEFRELEAIDKKNLFYNFYSRWGIFEMVMFSIKNNDLDNFFSPSGSIATSLTDYYLGYGSQRNSLSEKDVHNLFQPFWNFHMDSVVRPLVKLKLSNVENMAILGLMLWDACYANISESLGELCRSMRKIICRELTSYFEDKDESGKRFFDALDSLNLIEQAERKCQEEIHICGMYNIEIDDTMSMIMTSDKY